MQVHGGKSTYASTQSFISTDLPRYKQWVGVVGEAGAPRGLVAVEVTVEHVEAEAAHLGRHHHLPAAGPAGAGAGGGEQRGGGGRRGEAGGAPAAAGRQWEPPPPLPGPAAPDGGELESFCFFTPQPQ